MSGKRKSEEVKHQYVLWLFESNKHYIRNFLLLYMCLYPLFGILDYYSSSQSIASIFNMHLFAGFPLLVAAYVCTFITRCIPYIRIINATALLGMNLNILLMYATIGRSITSFDTYYSALIVTIAILGLSMSNRYLTNIYIGISATAFIIVSYVVHRLHITHPFLFFKSSSYVLVSSGLFMVGGIVVDRLLIKLYRSQENMLIEKDEISEQKEVLENLNQTKDRFFRIISHDLRSPFTALIGYFEVLLRNNSKEVKVKKDDIQKIYLHTRRTYNLLNNLLNWSKTQLNQYDHNPKQYKLSEIFSENKALYREIALQKDIKIIHSIPVDAMVYCDKEMIATIVRNLIFNAIKATKPQGEITLTARQLTDNEMEIAVIDTGVGISKQDIDMILNPLTSNVIHDEQGAGIGLMICNDILQKHQSHMQIESAENRGSKFFFVLPTQA